ncbi:MAG: hypothetical protein U0168_01095 [Nannocystaceae bacterium]
MELAHRRARRHARGRAQERDTLAGGLEHAGLVALIERPELHAHRLVGHARVLARDRHDRAQPSLGSDGEFEQQLRVRTRLDRLGHGLGKERPARRGRGHVAPLRKATLGSRAHASQSQGGARERDAPTRVQPIADPTRRFERTTHAHHGAATVGSGRAAVKRDTMRR